MSFCCGETDEFGSREGECGGDEDVAEAFEAVVEGSRVGPVFAADVAAVLGSATIYDCTKDSGKCEWMR